jgi:predicted dehydrogenase
VAFPFFAKNPSPLTQPKPGPSLTRAGPRLFVGHIWCYHPGVEALAAIARSGELGPVHGLRSTRTNWTSPRTDVDSSWNLAPHDIALAQFILGEIPPPRFALAERLDGRCVGLIGILGSPDQKNSDLPWAVFEVSNRHREKRREVRLHCRDGVAVLPDADTGHIEITRSDNEPTGNG